MGNRKREILATLPMPLFDEYKRIESAEGVIGELSKGPAFFDKLPKEADKPSETWTFGYDEKTKTPLWNKTMTLTKGKPVEHPLGVKMDRSPDYRAMSLREAVETFLRLNGTSSPTSIHLGTGREYSSVSATLSNHKKAFRRVSPGIWGLIKK